MSAKPPRLLRYPRVSDLIPRAQRRMPGFAWGYLSHGWGRETLLRDNIAAFDAVTFQQRLLRDTDLPNTATQVLGQDFDLPFGIAPVGLGSMMWPGAEHQLADVAHTRNLPMVLSTVANVTLEEIAERAKGNLWFQLYSTKTPEIRHDLIDRAKAAGIETLVLTIDVPATSRREFASVSGLPERGRLTARMMAQAARCPAWSLAALRNGWPDFVNLRPYAGANASYADVGDLVARNLGRRVMPKEVAEIRERWPGKLVIKGILSVADAHVALDLGADALWLSNHGGRQNDAVPTSLVVLPEIRAALPETPLFLDSGVRSGLDVLRALSLGADFVFLGRPWFYGMATLGQVGAQHVADVLEAEVLSTMHQFALPDLRPETFAVLTAQAPGR